MTYLLLIGFWMAWCALHSALIAPAVTEWFRRRFPKGFRYYRILYNLFAVISLVPVLLYAFSLRQVLLVAWTGLWVIVPVLLGAAALCFFVAGAAL